MQTLERWSNGPTIIGSLWRFRYLVLTLSLLGGVAGFVSAQLQTPIYEASTRMYVAAPEATAVFNQQGTDLERHIPQEVQRLTSSTVLEAVADRLDDGETAVDIREQVEVEGDIELATLSVAARDTSPERAAEVANAVADAYQEDVRATQQRRVERATEELDQSAEELEEQIDALLAEAPGDIGDEAGLGGEQVASQVGVLTQRLLEIEALAQQLQVDARVFDTGVEFREPAVAPTEPVAPRPRQSAAVGLLLAAMAATAFAYWRAGRENRIESRDTPASVLDAPLLGALPTYKPPQHVTLAQRTALEPRTAEAYRFAYSSLLSNMRAQGASSVMVSSGEPGAGKTETAVQLAATAARRGQHVLLVDADLRMRGVTRALQAQRAPGLIDLAAFDGRRSQEEVIRRYPVDQDHGLDVLTTGSTSSDGEHQLSASWFGTVFKQLVADYDLTIVDSPPLLAVADAAIIAEHADSILLVIREGVDIGELERVRQRLGFVQQGRDSGGHLLAGYVYLTPQALEDSHLDYGLVRSGWKPGAPGARTANGGFSERSGRRTLSGQQSPDRG
jgi:Mrp family chromosome partitioning ATPase